MMINSLLFYYFFESFHSTLKQRNEKGNKNNIVPAAFMFYEKLIQFIILHLLTNPSNPNSSLSQ